MNKIGPILFLASIASFNVEVTAIYHSDNELERGRYLESSAPSTTVLDFVSYISGNYDNEAQRAELGNTPEPVTFRMIPVAIKCLKNASGHDAVVFVEKSDGKRVLYTYLAKVEDGLNDHSVSVTAFLFKNHDKYTGKLFSADTLRDIPCEDIQEVKNCPSELTFASDGFWFGNLPQCVISYHGIYLEFDGSISCDRLSVSLVGEFHEIYKFERKGARYPLINPPPGYVPPCGE